MPSKWILFVLIVWLAACAHREEAKQQKDDLPVVAAVQATRQSIDRTLQLVAEFRPYREIDLMAKVSGYVKQINVDMGDRVQVGQVLATLEIPEMADDLNRANASIRRSDAEVARARQEVKRAETARELAQLQADRLSNVAKLRPGLLAQQEIDAARSRALEAAAQWSGASSALIAAEQGVQVMRAEEQRVTTLLNYTRVTAPFAGVVTRRFAEVGSMVQAGTASQTNVLPVVRLSQDSVLRLYLPIPESVVPLVRVGFPVQISVPTLDREINAKIARYSSELQLSTRTMTAQVDVENPSFLIKPGMFAEVTIRLESKPNAIVVPLLALDGTGETRQAMRISPEGLLKSETLRIGPETSEVAEILGGVQEGDLFVLSGRAQLKPGTVVKPRVTGAVK
ncbi:efflux RND transporter periplasmic adaptor subunit [Bryobacter aggregatus]|uniref:efflux RND transporter periplasmic adaptor subunit n=1 Tax=Bryobacter aggregatus TaxID=360054 RepID=UPI0004E0CFBF|nr:efflux RND transporter periplasmic adaptor subunit [Bryobacter aggregatus]